MKSSLKVLFSVLALGVMATSPLLRAADEKAPAGETPKGGKGGRGGMPSPEDRIAAIEKAVGTLTTDQKAKIKDIYAKAAEQMQALRGGGGGDREAARAKMQEMNKSTHDQIRALLTSDEQKKKFDDMPVPARGGPGGGGGGKGGRKKGN